MSQPLVSILILTYNQEDYIEETLLSILKQNYLNLQLIISDDASTDKTPEIIRDFVKNIQYETVTHFNSENIGITQNFSQALSSCTGKYIALLDGDDLFKPSKIERQVAIMEKNPTMGISYHDVEVFDSNSKKTIYFWKNRYFCRNIFGSDLVRSGPFLPYSSVMVRSKNIPKETLFENINTGSDWLFYIEVLLNSKGFAGWLDEELAGYRRHSQNVTNSWDWKFVDQIKTLQIVQEKWPDLITVIKKRKSEVYLIHSVRQFAVGAFKKGLSAFIKSYSMSFPWFTSFFRLGFREIKFLIKQKGKADDLLKSLFNNEKNPNRFYK